MLLISEPDVGPHRICGLHRDVDEQFDSRRVLALREGLQELLGRNRNPRNERVIFEKAVQAFVRNTRCDSSQLGQVVWHAKGIEERLEAVVEVAPMLDDRAWSLTAKEEDVERAGELVRPVDDRYELKSAECHGKVHHLQWAWYLYLASLQDSTWQRLRSRLLKQGLLLAQLLKLKVDRAADVMLLLDAPIGRERSTIPKHEVHYTSTLLHIEPTRPSVEGECLKQ